VFAQFHLDLSRGDALVGEPDRLEGSDLLDFAEIPAVRFPVYPIAQHLAEKLRAYSLPRDQVNTRVKDLVDMVAIAAIDRVRADVLAASIEATFTARGTHLVLDVLPDPPTSWRSPYARLSGESPTAPTTDLNEAVALAEPSGIPSCAKKWAVMSGIRAGAPGAERSSLVLVQTGAGCMQGRPVGRRAQEQKQRYSIHLRRDGPLWGAAIGAAIHPRRHAFQCVGGCLAASDLRSKCVSVRRRARTALDSPLPHQKASHATDFS